jgi:hypothetical protein
VDHDFWLFDPSMSALPITVKQNSPSVRLFNHKLGETHGSHMDV